MNVIVAHGTLPDRDANLSDVPRDFFKKTKLSVYQLSTEMKSARQEGQYRSRQGPTITPIPLWAIEFQTTRRKVGDTFQILPSQEGGQYVTKTARWASSVVGTGAEKKKWRKMAISGPCSLDHVFATVTSAWLVPFALAHRYLIHVPGEINGKGASATISVRHDFASTEDGLDAWTTTRRPSDSGIRNWTVNAQHEWTKKRTERSTPLVTQWLDYRGKLSSQRPNAFRVVHTRSRSFYAAVLDPRGSTALGLPFNKARMHITEGGKTVRTNNLPIAGVICDNLLHSVVVESKAEAYWMSGLFNSKNFNEKVMKQARGEPPGIYTIPIKVMEEFGIVFSSNDSTHIELAKTAEGLEGRMRKVIRRYLSEEKSLDIAAVDDTDQSPDVPSTISSALMRRLDAQDELDKLNRLADKALKNR